MCTAAALAKHNSTLPNFGSVIDGPFQAEMTTIELTITDILSHSQGFFTNHEPHQRRLIDLDRKFHSLGVVGKLTFNPSKELHHGQVRLGDVALDTIDLGLTSGMYN